MASTTDRQSCESATESGAPSFCSRTDIRVVPPPNLDGVTRLKRRIDKRDLAKSNFATAAIFSAYAEAPLFYHYPHRRSNIPNKWFERDCLTADFARCRSGTQGRLAYQAPADQHHFCVLPVGSPKLTGFAIMRGKLHIQHCH